MHPLIRIVSLLVVALLAPWLPAAALPFAAAGFCLWGIIDWSAGSRMWSGLRRVRWLLLSIAIFFLWFSPGKDLWPLLGAFSPSDTGFQLAFHHAGVLALMIWAAAAFLGDQEPGHVAAAMRVMLAFPVRTRVAMRFADRVGLLLAALPELEGRVRQSLMQRDLAFAQRAADLLFSIEQDTRVEYLDIVPPLRLEPVPALQWLLPAALLVVGMLLIFASAPA